LGGGIFRCRTHSGLSLAQKRENLPVWWANQTKKGHSQTAGWRDAGWRTRNVDIKARRLVFERDNHKGNEARRVTRDSRDDFATRGAIAFLNGLGGTMPDFNPAPRDRPKA
jgi:hypothetical protein